MLLNCIIPKAGMQQDDTGVTGEKKQGRPWPGNGLNSHRKKKEDSENGNKPLGSTKCGICLVKCAYHSLEGP
jgi:hypothetical protein